MINSTTKQPVLLIDRRIALPDNAQWQNRFEIHSETSNRVYTIAQNKAKKHWGCSCPGWIYKRKCKHLEALGIPSHSVPYQPQIVNTKAALKRLNN